MNALKLMSFGLGMKIYGVIVRNKLSMTIILTNRIK